MSNASIVLPVWVDQPTKDQWAQLVPFLDLSGYPWSRLVPHKGVSVSIAAVWPATGGHMVEMVLSLPNQHAIVTWKRREDEDQPSPGPIIRFEVSKPSKGPRPIVDVTSVRRECEEIVRTAEVRVAELQAVVTATTEGLVLAKAALAAVATQVAAQP